ncbi:DUF7556 family protein [Natrinema gelatinilyticum]|uniref:DUF7556 family protein n=1 Tax=Natrinema gelatinilyticum TaxID=2961571 RepID=UPI0020C49B27|nr:hypothetical protein [Natrinema gelatinilyticum]
MVPDGKPIGRPVDASSDVVASIDEIDGQSHLVIADIGRDDAWIAMSTSETPVLDDER